MLMIKIGIFKYSDSSKKNHSEVKITDIIFLLINKKDTYIDTLFKEVFMQ